NSIVGMYVAQPEASGGGEVVTCAEPGGSVYNASQLWDNCRNKLTVKGSITAKSIILNRANGSMRDDVAPGRTSPIGNAGSEVLNFTPEHWIVRPESLYSESSDAVRFNSSTPLPPLL